MFFLVSFHQGPCCCPVDEVRLRLSVFWPVRGVLQRFDQPLGCFQRGCEGHCYGRSDGHAGPLLECVNYSAQCSAGSSASSSFRLVVRLLARLHFEVRLAWLVRRCGRLRFLVRSTFGHVSGVCGARLLVEVICHRGVSVLVLDPFIFHEFVFVLEILKIGTDGYRCRQQTCTVNS